MTTNNVIVFITLMLLGLIMRILSMILYPIAFLFQKKILAFINNRVYEDNTYHIFVLKPGVKKWKLYINPLFWGFLFTTGITDKYCGPLWFKKENKLKWFSEFEIVDPNDVNSKYPIAKTFIQKLRYFWISYQWGALRNPCYAFSDWIAREGQGPAELIKIYKCDTPDNLDIAIMPGVKFKDKDGTDRNNKGPYIRYTFDAEEKWLVTNEGVKILVFTTHRGGERFTYGKCKIYKLDFIKRFFILELMYGWNWWDGVTTLHQKFIFRKIDDYALADYEKYQEYLKTIEK